MTSPTFALGIPHTPWRPERVTSLARLLDALDIDPDREAGRIIGLSLFAERAPNHVWSEAMWRWGAERAASHFLTLQDDVIVPWNFQAALRAMVEAVPDQVICLEVVHGAAPLLAASGHRWFTTSDGMVGVGYVVPTALLREFLYWRATALKPGAIREAKPGEVQEINEDTLLALWCLSTGRKVWHPIPTLIDHDTTMTSSYGNDGHQARRPAVRWDSSAVEPRDLSDPRSWYCTDTPPPHLGRMPWRIAELAAKWVEGFGPEQYMRAMTDDGAPALRRASLLVKLQSPPPKHRLYLATPNKGHCSQQYATSIGKLVAASEGGIFLDEEAELRTVSIENQDIVLRRSRMVRNFLMSDCSHLLFVDSDIEFSIDAVYGMLSRHEDFIAAPYPKRDGVNWGLERMPDPLGRTLEQRAYNYAVVALEDRFSLDPMTGCVEVAGVGLGCALLSRSCIEKMVASYGSADGDGLEGRVAELLRAYPRERIDRADVLAFVKDEIERHDRALQFIDEMNGGTVATVALFQLMIRSRQLRSEDYSFCRRWRDIGGRVILYLGPGSPVTHHGSMAYKGHLEHFGQRRP